MSRHERAFWVFHQGNPDVMDALVGLARQAKRAGAGQYGMKALFEVLRWSRLMEKRPGEEFRLNNNYTAYYARLIMALHPDLSGFFETRVQFGEGGL